MLKNSSPNRKKSRLVALIALLVGFPAKDFAFFMVSPFNMVIVVAGAVVGIYLVARAVQNTNFSASNSQIQTRDQDVFNATSDPKLREVIRRLGGNPNDSELARKVHDEAIEPNKIPGPNRRNPDVDLKDPNVLEDIKRVIKQHRSSMVASQEGNSKVIGVSAIELEGTWIATSKYGSVGEIIVKKGEDNTYSVHFGRTLKISEKDTTSISRAPEDWEFIINKEAKIAKWTPFRNDQKNPKKESKWLDATTYIKREYFSVPPPVDSRKFRKESKIKYQFNGEKPYMISTSIYWGSKYPEWTVQWSLQKSEKSSANKEEPSP
jgi:hypothetical protein